MELVYEPAVIRGSYGGSVRGSYGVGRGSRLTRLVQRFSTRLVKKNVVERRCGWSVWGHSAYGGREVYGDVTQVATTCEHKCEYMYAYKCEYRCEYMELTTIYRVCV